MVGAATPHQNHQEYGRHAAEKVAKEQVVRQYVNFLTAFGSDLDAIDQVYQNCVRDKLLRPVGFTATPHEDTSLTELISSDNDTLRKVILTLSYLVQEMDSLIDAGKPFFYTLVYYGEGLEDNQLQNGECHACVGKMFQVLKELLDYVTHAYQVVSNTLQQLSQLYTTSENGSSYLEVGETHFKIIFERLGHLLSSLVTLDSVIRHSKQLTEHVAQFQHVIRSLQHNNQSAIDVPLPDLVAADLVLEDACVKLLSGTIFLRCVTQNFGPSVSNNTALLAEISVNVKGFLQDISLRIMKEDDVLNLEICRKFMSSVCIYVLHAHLDQRVDKKQLKTIMDQSRSILAVPLVGPCLWLPDEFLSTYLPHRDKVLDQKAIENIANARFAFLRHKSQQLIKDVPTWNMQILLWLSRLSSQTSGSQEELGRQCSLILQGQRLVGDMSVTVRLILNLHLAIQPVISKATVVAVFQTLELIKTVESSVQSQLNQSPQAWLYFQQQLKRTAQEMITAAKKKVASEKRPTERLTTIFSALLLASNMLRGPCTTPRVSVTRLSLAIVLGFRPQVITDEDLPLLANILQKMELVAHGVFRRMQSLADCEMLYWHKSLLVTYLTEAHEKHYELSRINLALKAVNDCQLTLQHVKHVDPQVLTSGLDRFIRRALKQHILEPLCAQVETELRIQTHWHLQPTDRNPFKNDDSSLIRQLNGESLLVGQQSINVKAYVEQYLGVTFYNLAAVASHDWRKYSHMRLLAKHLFDIRPVEDRLPSQTLEQGLDVLEIMRNIQIFVSRFNYNLNNQFFVEASSSSKHLNTIGIRHVSNSIRTHGTGVVNTAVNFTYQFLRKKFFIFSQFLFDEHIKSRLMKDARFLRDLANDKISVQDSSDPMRPSRPIENSSKNVNVHYPYDRAEKFHRGIRKLGLTQGLSFLDQFRILITHIGNALGYIRMLRSGAIHCSAEACAPVPDLAELVYLNETSLDNLADKSSTSSSLRGHNESTATESNEGLFESLARSSEILSQWSIKSSRALDKVLDDLARSLSDSSDYFRLLVDVFQPFFRDPRHSHLRHFYLIVPPLTVNFVEHIVTCKEKLNKKNKQSEATFTDDGLAMGIAYCLSVLNQWKDFDSLQWPTSVNNYFDQQRIASRASSSQASQSGQDAEKLQQTLSLTLHRLDTYKQEFDLLFYSMNSARIFFREERSTTNSHHVNATDKNTSSSSSLHPEVHQSPPSRVLP